MKPNLPCLAIGLSVALLSNGFAQKGGAEPNPKIDYDGFLEAAAEVREIRQPRRIDVEQFRQFANDPDTILLDARSAEKFGMLHVAGAINLPLPDFDEASLKQVIPAKATRVLIYCNNNFENEEVAFTSKSIRASLNLYTYNSLHAYGYTNVYELGPLLDVRTSDLALAGTRASKLHAGEQSAPE